MKNNTIILALGFLFLNSTSAFANCPTAPEENVSGKFRVTANNPAEHKCAWDKDGNAAIKDMTYKPEGCFLKLHMDAVTDGKTPAGDYTVYGNKDQCTSKVGDLVDLKLTSTNIECCNVNDNELKHRTSRMCSEKGTAVKAKVEPTEQEIRCFSEASHWKIQ